MFRSMTSNVSAVSGIVANGHQTLHLVSPAPSKIPYGGFSPVRLQTRLTPRPPSRAYPRPLIGRHCRYLVSRRFARSRSFDQTAPRTSDHDRGSSGPWLPSRLYLSGRIVAYYGHICASVGHPTAYGLFRRVAAPIRQPQRVPNLLCQSVHSVSSPVLRWLPRVHSTMSSSWTLAFAFSAWARQPQVLAFQNSRGLRNEAAAFALCYDPVVLLAPLWPGLLRPSFHGPGHPRGPRWL